MNVNDLKAKYLNKEFKLKSEFLAGDYKRTDLLDRCVKYAAWTLPYIFPDEDLIDSQEMQNDYQSVGARLVTHFANKVMNVLFQPARPFFKLDIPKEQIAELVEQGGLSEPEIKAGLASAERESMKEFAKGNARVACTDSVLLEIITGNSMLYWPKGEDMQVFSLRDYVLTRNLKGHMVKAVIRETKLVEALDDDLAALCEAAGYSCTDEVSIYTGICKAGKKFVVWQELEDICYCHKQMGVYEEEDLPWYPQAWNLVRGQDYGVGLVESYAGDFHSLSTIAEAILDFTTVTTDVKTLVNPTGMTNVKEISTAPSGAYVQGRREDLETYTADVAHVTDFLEKQFASIERRLGAVFLLNSAVTRDAERVTAEEIRLQASELEGAHTGSYSRKARDMQMPIARGLVSRVEPDFKGVDPVIVTGLESLSRNSELAAFRAFMSDLAALSDVPDDVKARMNMDNIIAVLGAGHGVDYKDLLLGDEVVKKKQQERASKQVAHEEAMVAAKTKGEQV